MGRPRTLPGWLPAVTGPMVSQACATSVACLARGGRCGGRRPPGCQLVVAADRTSNGPQLSYPAPSAPGGARRLENWVLDNFARDPWAGNPMIEAGERVAADRRRTRASSTT